MIHIIKAATSRLLLSVCGRVSFAKMSASIKNVDAAEFEVVKQ